MMSSFSIISCVSHEKEFCLNQQSRVNQTQIMIIDNGPKMGPCGTTIEQVFGNHNLGIFVGQTESRQHVEILDYLLTTCNYELFSKTAVVLNVPTSI